MSARSFFGVILLGLGLGALVLFFGIFHVFRSEGERSKGSPQATGAASEEIIRPFVDVSVPAGHILPGVTDLSEIGDLLLSGPKIPVVAPQDQYRTLRRIDSLLRVQPGRLGSRAENRPSPAPRELSEQEIFDRIWPSRYRKTLQSFEVIVSRDWTRAGETNLDSDPRAYNTLPARAGTSVGSTTPQFSTDEDIYRSLLRIGEGAYRQGWIAENDYRMYQKGVRDVLPGLTEQEKAELRNTGTRSRLLLRDQSFATEKNARSLVRDLIDGVKYIFFLADPAYASWVTQPECYKDDDPDNKQEGVDAAAFCCNCGLKCGKACVYVHDCGQNGQNCNVQLGCLNQICGQWKNAIWDPQTFICGCG